MAQSFCYPLKGFTEQYNNPTSGLDSYVSRYYDPMAGVFLSPYARPVSYKLYEPVPVC
jgi:hypothetical protein